MKKRAVWVSVYWQSHPKLRERWASVRMQHIHTQNAHTCTHMYTHTNTYSHAQVTIRMCAWCYVCYTVAVWASVWWDPSLPFHVSEFFPFQTMWVYVLSGCMHVRVCTIARVNMMCVHAHVYASTCEVCMFIYSHVGRHYLDWPSTLVTRRKHWAQELMCQCWMAPWKTKNPRSKAACIINKPCGSVIYS